MTSILERLRTMEEWLAYSSIHPEIYRQDFVDDLGEVIKAAGFIEPLTHRRVEPTDLTGSTSGWREDLAANGLNSRMRAMMLVLEDLISDRPNHEISIFGAEAVTSLGLLLRGRFARYYGSEFANTQAEIDALFPIPHQDLTSLTLPSCSFDIATTNEVLEHVSDIDAALSELARILKVGGNYVGTMPFGFTAKDSIRRASLVGGDVVHHLPPEYHGNPINPTSRSLVFEVPAWDILDRARRSGFSEASMAFVASSRHGVLSENLGVFVMCARK